MNDIPLQETQPSHLVVAQSATQLSCEEKDSIIINIDNVHPIDMDNPPNPLVPSCSTSSSSSSSTLEQQQQPQQPPITPPRESIGGLSSLNRQQQYFFSRDQQCFMEWKNISYPSMKKPLLDNLSGFAVPGKITALVGPAGSGKSMLLRVLSRRGPFKLHDGSILLNGQVIQDKLRDGLKTETNVYRSLVSFVAKDYNLSDLNLTVRETLLYALRFKVPASTSSSSRCTGENVLWSNREDRLLMLLKNYRLESKQHVMCSALSSGERKRLTIAVQNVNFHRVVMLEDPTDGMEYGEALMMMKTIKVMAQMGMAVILSVHKPSWKELELFDYVSILDRGRQIYFGSPHRIEYYFNHVVGIELNDFKSHHHHHEDEDEACTLIKDDEEKNYNRSHHGKGLYHNSLENLLQVLFVHELCKNAHDFSAEKNLPIKQMIESNHMDAIIMEKRDHLAEEFEKRFSDEYIPQKTLEEKPFVDNHLTNIHTEKYLTNYWLSIIYLITRLFIVKKRNWKTEFVAPFIEKTLIGIGIGLLYLQVDAPNMAMRARVFAFLNYNLSLTFGVAIRVLIQQIPTLMQERTNSSSYRISAFFIAKTVEDLFDFTVYPFIFGLVVYFMTGMSMDAGKFFTFSACFIVYNWACMALAQALVCLFPFPFILGWLCVVVNIYFILVSGAYGQTMLPSGLQWTSYLSYLYYGFRSMAINEFAGVIIPVQNGTVLPPTYFTNGTYFLKRAYNIEERWYMSWVYIAVLVGYFLICKYAGYLGLKYIYGRKSPKRIVVKLLRCCGKCK
ncbi:hypothetical protein C9374_000631 [Naegleria lovaniensis]|uniref:ABC transporter domain-containing protein n=1 Tax=Naegleria lovaniensis TaxID=51637 RepID=A0AA88KT71_NAELO|nr:uncharacterized protein C9374_000631 [Naegleria lovaniensis]KAG2388467.1 hypothetical protein C9374_000631 [Naegleria lovaniensis]